ncbi:MAG: CHAT domain-containing protein [Bacteroidota bacterium]
MLGKYSEALYFYNLAEKSAFIKANPDTIAPYFRTMAYIYEVLGDYKRALSYSKKDLSSYIKQKKSVENIPEKLLNTGLMFIKLWEFDSASKYLNASEYLCNKVNKKQYSTLGNVITNKGYISFFLGDFDKAIRMLDLSLFYFEKENSAYSFYYKSGAYQALGLCYMQKHEYAKALECITQSIELKRNSPYPYFQEYGELAKCYNYLKDSANAENCFKWALLNPVESQNIEIRVQYGKFLCDHGRFKDGDAQIKMALAGYLAIYGLKHQETSLALQFQGYYWLKMNKPDSALYYYQKALIAVSTGFDDMSFLKNPDIKSTPFVMHLGNALNGKAKAYALMAEVYPAQKEYYLNLSLRTYEKAMDLLSMVQKSYMVEDSKLFLSELGTPIYLEAIDVAVKLHSLTRKQIYLARAFRYAELNKAGALMADQRNASALSQSGVPSQVIEFETKLKNEIAGYEKVLSGNGSAVEAFGGNSGSARQKLVQLYAQREKLTAWLEKEYPAYYAAKYSTQTADPVQFSRLMPKGMALVEYACTDSVIYAFVVTCDSFSVVRIKTDTSFYGIANKFKTDLARKAPSSYTNKYIYGFGMMAHKLYVGLMEPLMPLLRDADHVVIAPDARLGYMTFDALMEEPPGDTAKQLLDFRGMSYLVERFAFSYVYSATWLSSALTAGDNQGSGMIAYAPDYSLLDSTPIPGTTRKIKLPPLREARREAEAVAGIWKGTFYGGTAATRASFIENAPEASILHLSMHSTTNEDNPLMSGLVFSPDGSPDDNGILDVTEIRQLSFKTDLVVLSACRTGSGKMVLGEGLMSLSRTFIYAGCRSIITSLWPVSDLSGSTIMQAFYRNLALGMSKDDALQKAKLDFIKKSNSTISHPAYWSGYILIGSPSPMKNIPTSHWRFYAYLISAVVFVAAFLFLFFYLRRKRKLRVRPSGRFKFAYDK